MEKNIDSIELLNKFPKEFEELILKNAFAKSVFNFLLNGGDVYQMLYESIKHNEIMLKKINNMVPYMPIQAFEIMNDDRPKIEYIDPIVGSEEVGKFPSPEFFEINRDIMQQTICIPSDKFVKKPL